MSQLDRKPQIWTLAVDLGLSVSDKPASQIVKFALDRVRRITKKYACTSLAALLAAVAADLGTVFEEIHSDDDLERVQRKYVAAGEKSFANLANELQSEDYAITLRRVSRAKWDPPFVSVIDCRGSKAFRAYFSKWHELAHLLTLTPQMRLVFRRTHAKLGLQDPEESLMDVIAGEAGFLADLLPRSGSKGVSFEMIERVRQEFCREASYQAALIGIVKALPTPCILIDAQLGLRKSEERQAFQGSLDLTDRPKINRVLRAVHVTVNHAARDRGIVMYKNWRVPADSIIRHSFEQKHDGEALEDLNWWKTSTGERLPDCPVRVFVQPSINGVSALLVPVTT